MAPPLPGDLIADAKEILVPHMRTQDDRDAHVTEAFYLAEQRLYHDIALEGTPNTFTVLCIKKLLTFGCLNDRQRARPTVACRPQAFRTVRTESHRRTVRSA